MERNNINVRAQFWQSLINHCTSTVCNRIFNVTSSTQRTKFEYKIPENINNSLMGYLLEWNGLNTKLIDSRKKPKNFTEYELKAKNWLNGRRAKEYSIGLYVDMIICAEKYANDLQKTLFNNLESKNYRQSCKDLFYDILMYSYLTEMCNKQCHINERKVWLLCTNSMKAHKQNETLRIFQLYAKDHDYVDQFPRHRNEAIDYFKAKMDNARDSLLILFQEIETQKIPHETSEKLLEIIYFISSKCQTPNGKNVIINTRTFSMIESAIKQLKHNVEQQQHEIKVLNDKERNLQQNNLKQIIINNNNNNHNNNDEISIEIEQHKEINQINEEHKEDKTMINPMSSPTNTIKTEESFDSYHDNDNDHNNNNNNNNILQYQYYTPYQYNSVPLPFSTPINLQYHHINMNNNNNNIRKRNMNEIRMDNINYQSIPNKRQRIINDIDDNMDNNSINNDNWDTQSINGTWNNWNYNPITGLYQGLSGLSDGQSIALHYDDNDLNITTTNTMTLNTLF